MDPDGKQLLPAAGPRVPGAFMTAITPWRIGPNRGSCGTAAFTKQRVIIPDISGDPRWPDEARALALLDGDTREVARRFDQFKISIIRSPWFHELNRQIFPHGAKIPIV